MCAARVPGDKKTRGGSYQVDHITDTGTNQNRSSIVDLVRAGGRPPIPSRREQHYPERVAIVGGRRVVGEKERRSSRGPLPSQGWIGDKKDL